MTATSTQAYLATAASGTPNNAWVKVNFTHNLN